MGNAREAPVHTQALYKEWPAAGTGKCEVTEDWGGAFSGATCVNAARTWRKRRRGADSISTLRWPPPGPFSWAARASGMKGSRDGEGDCRSCCHSFRMFKSQETAC